MAQTLPSCPVSSVSPSGQRSPAKQTDCLSTHCCSPEPQHIHGPALLHTHFIQDRVLSHTPSQSQAVSVTHRVKARPSQSHTESKPGRLSHTPSQSQTVSVTHRVKARPSQSHTESKPGRLSHTPSQSQAVSVTHRVKARPSQSHTESKPGRPSQSHTESKPGRLSNTLKGCLGFPY